MYSISGKLLNGIRSMYVNSLVDVKMKSDESKSFRIYSDVTQGCIMSPLHFNVYINRVMKEMGMGRM